MFIPDTHQTRSLLQANSLLTGRLKPNSRIHVILAIIALLYFAVVCPPLTYLIFSAEVSFTSTSYDIAQLVFFALLYDVFLSVFRYGRRTSIESHHLSVFPMSISIRNANELLLHRCDFQTGIYVMLAVSLTVHVAIQGSIPVALFSVPIVAIVALNGTICVSICYRLLGNRTHDNRLQMIPFAIVPLSIFVMVNALLGSELFNWFPVAADIGMIVTGILLNDFAKVDIHPALLLLWACIGIAILALLGRRSYRK